MYQNLLSDVSEREEKRKHVNERIKLLTAGAVLVSSVWLWPIGSPPAAHASISPVQDPCAAPLPKQVAMTGGPGTKTMLRASGLTFYLSQFRGGLGQELSFFHVKPLPNDDVAEFDLVLPHRVHVYAGPTHVFRHGGKLHLCRSGPVMVDAHGNTSEQINPYTVQLRLDGTIVGSRAWINVWVGRAHYRLAGHTSTQS